VYLHLKTLTQTAPETV